MDPVTAIGVASAVVQFVQFSLQALSTCRQIRDSAQSSSKYNSELEKAVRVISAASKELETRSKSKTPRRIGDISRDCVQLADELTKLLEHVRGANQNTSKAKAIFRALKDQRKIEKLEQNLKNKQDLLNQALTQDTWIQSQLLVVEQSRGFGKLDQGIQSLVKHLLDESKQASEKLSRLELNHHSGLQSLDRNITAINDKAHARYLLTERNSQDRHDKEQLRQRQDRFLNSLFFADIHARREIIDQSAPDTLEWIFSTPVDVVHPRWDNFVAWLRDTSSDDMYWMRGNAGSGKSTLMAHVVDDPRTSANLKVCCGARDLLLLSFYFWLPGSELQKSKVGLLRSLLFQICQARPSSIDVVLNTMSMNVDRLGSWTEKILVKSITAAIAAAHDMLFAVFIDALDEHLGDYDALIELVSDFQQLENVKCCVSSRPEIHFVKRLSGCKQLQLERLNHGSIKTFVESRLAAIELDLEIKHDLGRHIIRHADGVFFWAALVVQDVIEGVISGDEDAEVLIKRIDSLPQELDKLFATMLAKVHPVHQQSLALYVSMVDTPFWAKDPLQLSIAVITATRMIDTLRTQPFSDDTFSSLCAQTENQIIAQSAGLLAMDQTWRWYDYKLDSRKVNHYFVKLPNAESPKSDPGTFSRTHCSTPPLFSSAYYECRNPRWVHRSAYDFIFKDGGSKLITYWLPSIEVLIPKIYEAWLWLISEAPSFAGRHLIIAMTPWRIKELLRVVRTSYVTCALPAKTVITRLRNIVKRMDPLEFECANNLVHWYRDSVVKDMPSMELLNMIGGVLIHHDSGTLEVCWPALDTGIARLVTHSFAPASDECDADPLWQSLGSLCFDTIRRLLARYTQHQENRCGAHNTMQLVTFSIPYHQTRPMDGLKFTMRGLHKALDTVSFKFPSTGVLKEADTLAQNEMVLAAMLLAARRLPWELDCGTTERFHEMSEMHYGYDRFRSHYINLQLPATVDGLARVDKTRIVCLLRRGPGTQSRRRQLAELPTPSMRVMRTELSVESTNRSDYYLDFDNVLFRAYYENVEGAVSLKLSDETLAALVDIVTRLLPGRSTEKSPQRPEIDRCRDMVIKDIWANHSGVLSSTEQLLALACVKIGFVEAFHLEDADYVI